MGRGEKGAIDFPEESKALRCILFMKWSGGEGDSTYFVLSKLDGVGVRLGHVDACVECGHVILHLFLEDSYIKGYEPRPPHAHIP